MHKSLPRMVRNAMIMMIGTFASRILGLAREILIAAFFGASRQLDAFYIAYTLANLSRQLLAEGALSASFVPVFTRTLHKDGKDRAWELARQATSVLLIAGSAVVIFGIMFSPLLVSIMAPGFDASEHHLATVFTRSMFPFLLFISMAALAMGVLNSMNYYFIPSVAPALSNILFIITVAILTPFIGIWSLVIAVLLGGMAQFGLQWLWTRRVGAFLWPAKPNKKDKELATMMKLFFPYAAGLSINQVNPVISRMLGSFLVDGAISILNYANRIIQLPLGLFVVAISQAVLPELSRSTLEKEDTFAELMGQSVRFTLFIILPATVGLILVSSEVVNILFVRGAFGEWAWKATSASLVMYAAGLPGMACNTVLLRGLYARNMARSAVIVTLTSVITNLLLSLILMQFLSYRGLALANSIAFTTSAFAGWIILLRLLGSNFRIFSASWVLKLSVSLFVMAAGIWAVRSILPFDPLAALYWRVLWLLVIIVIAVIIFYVSSRYFRFSEWDWIRSALKRKGK